MDKALGQQIIPTNWDKHWKAISGASLIERWRIHSVWSGYKRLLLGVQLPQDPRILELGAGTGHVSLRLIQKFGGHATLIESNAMAVAYSEKMWSQTGLMRHVTHFHGGIFKFSDREGFDIVHSGGVIEHFHGPDKEKIVEAHVKRAKNTGCIIVVVPIAGPRYFTFKAFLTLLGKWIYTDEIPWSPEEVEGAFEKYGYRVTRKTIIGHEMGYLLEAKSA